MEHLTTELLEKASRKISLAEDTVDDVLTYALFPQVGLKVPEKPSATQKLSNQHRVKKWLHQLQLNQPGRRLWIETYSVKVDGHVYDVEVGPQGQLTSVTPAQKAKPRLASCNC